MSSVYTKWTALVLAGQRPGVDPLAAHFGLTYKALVPLAGKPMVARVVKTLLDMEEIGTVTVLAQDLGAIKAVLPDHPRLSFEHSSAGISSSIRQVVGSDGAPWPVLVTTADHPLLTAEMVRHFITQADQGDVAVAMVERRTLRAAYPQNRRTWLKFAGGAWSGANLFALRTSASMAALDLWAEAEQDRKHAFRLFWHFGPRLALRAITRTIGLASALRIAGQRIGIEARLVPLPFAEAAIDVDKEGDHVLAEWIFSQRNTGC